MTTTIDFIKKSTLGLTALAVNQLWIKVELMGDAMETKYISKRPEL